jgi:hypothetical protein
VSSKRELILQAAAAALAGLSPVGSRVFRSRIEAFQRSEAPSIVVEPGVDEAAAALAMVVAGDVLGDRDGLVVEYTLVAEMARRPGLEAAYAHWQATLETMLADFESFEKKAGADGTRDQLEALAARLAGAFRPDEVRMAAGAAGFLASFLISMAGKQAAREA